MKISSHNRRVFAIGDIHGCANELEALLQKLEPAREDVVIFLGDYIDRGPNSAGVIDLILDLSTRCEVVALKGNHEDMFENFLETPESAGAGLFILNGGSATLASYAGSNGSFELPAEHLEFFKNLKLYCETETHFFVHAGVPEIPLASLDEKEWAFQMLWSRQPFLSTSYMWEKVIVHGHTPMSQPEIRNNRINLDTGLVYDGHLTAIELPSGKITQIERGQKGIPPLFVRERSDQPRVAMRFEGRLPVEAKLPGQHMRRFTTLNYNQFGLLLQDLEVGKSPRLKVGDRLEGHIGPGGQKGVDFAGAIVRAESRGEMVVYGVRMDRISSGTGGRSWIERPTG